jgi:LuxR family maltose regulon positive regulatory protein
LIQKLLAGLEQPGTLVLLSGPAGFGKTTLISELAARLDGAVAWVSLDDRDNDPIRFWTYLITACASIQPGMGDSALALLQSPQFLPDEAVPCWLILPAWMSS